MPYTEAVIHEVLRSSSLASTGVQHIANTDTWLAGYTIPKVISQLSVHRMFFKICLIKGHLNLKHLPCAIVISTRRGDSDRYETFWFLGAPL